MTNATKDQICRNVAADLRNFGYPDVSAEMIGEIYDAYRSGLRGADLPHGIIGRFAENSLDLAAERIGCLPD